MTEREQQLNGLYDILACLVPARGGPRALEDWTSGMVPGSSGVYFFFESGEARRNGSPRIVRVGESSNLQSRLLDQHLNGTHRDDHRDENSVFRSSRFRKYVGAVLIKQHNLECPTWMDCEEPCGAADRRAERDVERRVTRVIGAMPAVWAPAHPTVRKQIEKNLIGLLSNFRKDILDAPSPAWLGRWSDYSKIRQSGLWNVQHVESGYNPAMLKKFAAAAGSVPG